MVRTEGRVPSTSAQWGVGYRDDLDHVPGATGESSGYRAAAATARVLLGGMDGLVTWSRYDLHSTHERPGTRERVGQKATSSQSLSAGLLGVLRPEPMRPE